MKEEYENCEVCGAPLKLCKSKFGTTFLGCSNFKVTGCKFTSPDPNRDEAIAKTAKKKQKKSAE